MIYIDLPSYLLQATGGYALIESLRNDANTHTRTPMWDRDGPHRSPTAAGELSDGMRILGYNIYIYNYLFIFVLSILYIYICAKMNIPMIYHDPSYVFRCHAILIYPQSPSTSICPPKCAAVQSTSSTKRLGELH